MRTRAQLCHRNDGLSIYFLPSHSPPQQSACEICRLIRTAIKLYANDSTDIADVRDLYALDSTTIDLCLALFPWARFRKYKAAVKMHTLLDLHGSIPTFIRIATGKVHDVIVLDEIVLQADAFYVMDRGYIDFQRRYRFTLSSAFFVVRTKANVRLQRRYSRPVDKTTGLRSDHTVILTSRCSATAYPDALRRVTYCDPETGKRLKFLTNNFALPALAIAEIYKKRWAVELFFRWIKQHLRIKAFFGTSGNAVKTQIWIAVSAYVLVAIVRKRLGMEASLYQIPQILSLTLFEKTPHSTGTSEVRFPGRATAPSKPVDSVRLLTEQPCVKVFQIA